MTDDQQKELQELLCKRGFAKDGVSRWGQPSLRAVQEGHEPQLSAEATPLQRQFVACAHATPSTGADLCASWVEQAFSRLGLGVVLGNAAELYNDYCHYEDTRDLKVGMIVAVSAHPYTAQGHVHGHVGLYVGNGVVMDSVAEGVREVPLELWLSAYGLMAQPRWGWLGSIGLEFAGMK